MHRKTDPRLIRRIIIVVASALLVVLIICLCFSCAGRDSDNNATPDEVSTTADTSVKKETATTASTSIEPTTVTIVTTEKATEQKETKPKKKPKATNSRITAATRYIPPATARPTYPPTTTSPKVTAPAKKSSTVSKSKPSDEKIYDGEFTD